jgi:actin-related protein 9
VNSHLNGEFNGVEETFASTSRATSILLQTTKTNTPVSSYLVGSQLDEALASGQDISVFSPFADGEISDWTQAEAIWCVLPIHIS